ncbi:MAG: hypothetical protein K0Q58_1592 [Microbacterium sp.]|nr:hypothetical protein [Microbacterium sp.]
MRRPPPSGSIVAEPGATRTVPASSIRITAGRAASRKDQRSSTVTRSPVDLGHVVPRALHRPDLVPARSERVGRVGRAPRIDDHRDAVGGDDERADVVVIVVLAVVPALGHDRQTGRRARSGPREEHLGGRQPHIAGERGARRRGVQPLRVGDATQQPPEALVLGRGGRPGDAVRGGVRPGVGIAHGTRRAVQGVPGLRDGRMRRPVREIDVPGSAEVHPVREGDRLAERRHPGRGVPGAVRGVRQEVQRLERAAGSVPPVGVALVDRAVGGQRRDVAVQSLHHEGDDALAQGAVGRVVEQHECRDEDVPVDPRVPVVHVAVQAVGHVGEDAAVHPEGVVVRRPAPRALLAQRPDAVDHLIDPGVVERAGRRDDGTAESALTGEDDLLPSVAIAVAMHPGGGARRRQGAGESGCVDVHRCRRPFADRG